MNRGRRFFLLGALAVPIARKIERLTPIVAPPPSPMQTLTVTFDEQASQVWAWAGPVLSAYAATAVLNERMQIRIAP